jgi:hypothetical protein
VRTQLSPVRIALRTYRLIGGPCTQGVEAGGGPPFTIWSDYRGVDPRLLSPAPPAAPNLLSQDRVEALSFATRGTYLVICAVNVHFADGMYGWVKVVK